MKSLIPWRKRNEMTSNFSPSFNPNFNQDPFAIFHQEMNSLFDRFFDKGALISKNFFDDKIWDPQSIIRSNIRVDISESRKGITVKAELPGMDAKDFDISLNDRFLTIKGEKKNEQETKEDNYHRVERSYGYFNRTIELPADVDQTKVDASYKRGVLKISLNKTKESKAKKIKVTSAK